MENPPLKMYFLFKMGIFHCYVCLPEGTFPYISKIIVKSFSNHCHLFALVGPLADGTMPTILCGAWPMVLEKSKPIFLAWVVFFFLHVSRRYMKVLCLALF